ncbi:MAG: DCC1-like thiol-disulfide oxidoreductase family protein [Pseudomonadota bacterium]
MIILFDSDCVLCSAWVQFVLRHERREVVRFVSAWSDEGLEIGAAHGMTADDLDQTFLVVVDGRGLTRSAAIFAVLGELRAPWRLARVLRVIPRGVLD